MKNLLQRLFKFVAYTAAGVVILLAVAVGLFRLFLPRLPEYQEDIKGWASDAIGMRVEFSGMDARWGLSGPEVEFYNAELLTADATARVVNAEVVSVGVGLIRLLRDRKLVVDRVEIRDTGIEVRQYEDGSWRFQGRLLDELLPGRRPAASGVGDFEIVGQDIVLNFLQPGDERPRVFQVDDVRVSRDANRLAIDAGVTLPADLGRRMSVFATRERIPANGTRRWDVTAEADDVDLPGIASLDLTRALAFSSGRGDVSAAVAFVDGDLQSGSADVAFRDVSVGDEPGFSIDGVFEYERGSRGWLLASNSFSLVTVNGPWPVSTLRVEASRNDAGDLAMLDVQTSYLRLEDMRLAVPWLPPDRQELVSSYDADGRIFDLSLTLGGMDTDSLRFDLVAELAAVGFEAVDGRPGLRGFTGTLRADRSGGRLEIDAPGVAVTYPKFLGRTAVLDEASGTLIWRRSDNRTTLLTDSIVLRNADFSIESNIEVAFGADGAAPIVDLAATWSVSDLGTIREYIPPLPTAPNTRAWLDRALLAGRIPRGSARLYGPLDKFPFDGGEGRLAIEAKVLDGRIKYLRRWPVAEIIDLDIAVENMRLFTERNRLVSAGNAVADAQLELTDFREPVIRLGMFSAGALEPMRQLLVQSPLAESVFGGRLDDISVTGDASVNLELEVPVRNPDALTFETTMQTSGARFELDGFPAPLTDLSGILTVRHDDIGSEGLGGTFLGRPVTIDVAPAPETLPDYRIAVSANGEATAEALVAEFGVPLEGRILGETTFASRLLFPRAGAEEKLPFTIEIGSDLVGLEFDLPRPVTKPPDLALPVSTRIEFPEGDPRIVSRGTATGMLSWLIEFTQPEGSWDLERGVIHLGEAAPDEPTAEAETRGLHLRGEPDFVLFEDWLALGQGEAAQTGIVDRIRSIDLTVGDLHILGQHLVDHQVRVDRSAFDWLVQVEGEHAAGSIVVPYDFQSGRELVLDMERLLLPGDEEIESEPSDVDPRSLPPIVVRAGEFAVGTRHLGQVEATFRHTADGLESEDIVATDATFEIAATGGWVIDESDPSGSRSYVTASLQSRDVERTMQRLDYNPGIISDDLSMLLDLNWSGGPSEDFLESLDGEVEVRIGAGQLGEVDPGAGRMFGLLSVVALPRRLALDFRDVFGRGFGFDKISGDFRVVDGATYTCNLSLEGPAANIGIVGRADLVATDYEQAAVVSANFGNTLPVVGGVLGGPQVAAVMLVFSQLFKKPLQEATEIYYTIEGSWDEPAIERAPADAFGANAAMANCIDETN